MTYIFSIGNNDIMEVDMTSKGLLGRLCLLRFLIGMYIAGWRWVIKHE